MSSYILNWELANWAVQIAESLIDEILDSQLAGGRSTIHIVILDPSDGNILYEETLGNLDKSTWRHPYDDLARAKAQLCHRTGMVARTVVNDAPWLLEEGDTHYAGGAYENGLVVAASGLQDYLDEMISWVVLSVIQGLCRHAVSAIPDDPLHDFLNFE
ncbi:MAG: hypothetical protein Q7K11_01625 [Candidatus Berkelbacteria bacterium]|nr:hypothetical protein [Candidatus Berkelbacteria bacterium]